MNKKEQSSVQQKTVNVLLNISRLMFGCVFIFSGFVKAIDPLGFTYKIEDYLNAFGGVFAVFADFAFPVAIILSTLELLIGFNFVFKILLKPTAYVAFLLMLVMTPLTLYIALVNPVADCGCFGDALVISNWVTFYKNLVLIVLVIMVLIFNKRFRPYVVASTQRKAVLVFVALGVGLSVYCFRHLPLIDFRPYEVETNIPESMLRPADAPSDVYETTFIYQKNGQQKEFTLENYPKEDSTWVFVDQKTVLKSEGYKTPIHDFSIVNAQFDDITEEILYNPGSTYLLIMYDVTKASVEGTKEAEKMYQKALKSGIPFYALTASTDDEVKQFVENRGVSFPFCKTDPITLKTIVRANPGLVLLKKGTIVGKWNWRDFN